MSQELFFGCLGGWVSWGLYHSYLFFFSFKKKKIPKRGGGRRTKINAMLKPDQG